MSLSRHALLNRELTTVELRLKDLDRPTPDARHGDDADRQDARQAGESQVLDRARLTDRRRLILAALIRIEDGGYGLCLTCAAPIGPKRLDAMPWAERCLSCQAALEIHAEAFTHAARLPYAIDEECG